jgi:hypothetical protein
MNNQAITGSLDVTGVVDLDEIAVVLNILTRSMLSRGFSEEAGPSMTSRSYSHVTRADVDQTLVSPHSAS